MANKQAEQQYQESEQDARLSSLEQQQQGYGGYQDQGGYPQQQQGYPQQGYPQQQGGYGSYPPQQQAPPPAAPPPAAEPSMMDQLSQLADLHNQGVLTDEEFAAAKAKLLGN